MTAASGAAQIIARIAGRHVLASVSGGKDSTAMCLHLQELGIPFEPVFLDTGWENPETYRYLRDELPGHIGPIRWLRSEVTLKPDLEALAQEFEARLGHTSPMVRWILKKGMFPSGARRYCTEELKVRPMGEYIDSLDHDVINAVGVRAQESDDRAKLPVWEEPEPKGLIDAETWRVIHGFTLDDVVAIHQRHGVTPNRNYFKGAKRVGCSPCIRSAKLEIRYLAENEPARIDLIADLEVVVGRLLEQRMALKGTTATAEGYHHPTWFQAPIPDRIPTGRFVCSKCAEEWPSNVAHACHPRARRITEVREEWPTWPIRRVVEWSRTEWGGKRLELFAAKSHELGCMRWGMCDVSIGGDE